MIEFQTRSPLPHESNSLVATTHEPDVFMLEVAEDEPLVAPSRGRYLSTVVSLALHIWVLSNLAQTAVNQSTTYYEPPLTYFLHLDTSLFTPQSCLDKISF